MAEFDQYSGSYNEELKRSLAGIGNIDLAVKSKLQSIETVLGSAGLARVDRFMDFGCGTGLLSQQLGRFAEEVIGLDVSLASLANSNAPDSHRVGYGGQSIPFRDNSLNAIVASCVFHHIDPAHHARILQELHRILVPGGVFIIIEHNPWNPVTRWVVNRCEFDADAILLTRGQAESLLKDAGFTDINSRFIFTVPPVNSPLASLDRAFGRLPLGAQFYVHGSKPLLAADNTAE